MESVILPFHLAMEVDKRCLGSAIDTGPLVAKAHVQIHASQDASGRRMVLEGVHHRRCPDRQLLGLGD